MPRHYKNTIDALSDRRPPKKSIPGAVFTIQTFGGFLGFNSHSKILVTERCFYVYVKSSLSNGTNHLNLKPTLLLSR